MAWTTPSTYVAGAILTAASLNTNVRDNSLAGGPIYATTAARDAAIPTPFAVQRAFVTATNVNYQYNGTAWVAPETLSVPPLAIVSGAASVPVATGTDVAFGFTTTVNTDAMVTTGTTSSTYANAGKVTANKAGVYSVQYTFTSAGHATGLRYVCVAKNGTGSPLNGTGFFWQMYVPSASAQTAFTGGGLINLAATDYLQLAVHQTSGADLTFNQNGCVFSVGFMGKTA